MSKQVTNITSMAESAEEERQARMRQYLLTMAFRTACVVLMVFVRGPLIWFIAAGAIFLPWIAVVLVNHIKERRRRDVERPDVGAIEIYRPPVSVDDWARAAHEHSTQDYKEQNQ